MTKNLCGKLLLSNLLLGGAVVSVLVDWNDSHIFNPTWHPHAVFHDVVLLGFLSLASLWALWLLWRRSAEPKVALLTAASVPVFFWGMFPIAWAVPGSSPSAAWDQNPPAFLDLEDGVSVERPDVSAGDKQQTRHDHPPHEHGSLDHLPLFPNEILAVVIVGLTALSVWLAWPVASDVGDTISSQVKD